MLWISYLLLCQTYSICATEFRKSFYLHQIRLVSITAADATTKTTLDRIRAEVRFNSCVSDIFFSSTVLGGGGVSTTLGMICSLLLKCVHALPPSSLFDLFPLLALLDRECELFFRIIVALFSERMLVCFADLDFVFFALLELSALSALSALFVEVVALVFVGPNSGAVK